MKGIEPSSSAWKAVALPLSYTRDAANAESRLPIELTPHSSCIRSFAFSMHIPSLPQWGVQDSNLRRQSHQIYSLTPLTARETPRIVSAAESTCSAGPTWTLKRSATRRAIAEGAANRSPAGSMSQRRDLNPQPADYKSAALPIELRWPAQDPLLKTSKYSELEAARKTVALGK